jgi:hypothetical protein
MWRPLDHDQVPGGSARPLVLPQKYRQARRVQEADAPQVDHEPPSSAFERALKRDLELWSGGQVDIPPDRKHHVPPTVAGLDSQTAHASTSG